jgi:tyrosinase
MAQTSAHEMVGATEAPVTLARDRHKTQIAISDPTGPVARALTAAAAPHRVFLNLENITSRGVPSTYGVYINLPDDGKPEDHRHLYAGLLPSFGVAEASRRDEHSPGSGLNHALDITEIVEWLKAHNQWDPKRLSVTFVPRGKNPGEVPVQVGRASLHYKVGHRPPA